VPIDVYELVDSFGEAALSGNGALFIGAGMSAAAGLPGWGLSSSHFGWLLGCRP